MENNRETPSRAVQRIVGTLMIIVCAAFIVWIWRTALVENYFYPKAAMIFPAFLVLGLGIILFPNYREERIARGEDISHLSGLKLLTPRWWAILVFSILAGAVNLLLLYLF